MIRLSGGARLALNGTQVHLQAQRKSAGLLAAALRAQAMIKLFEPDLLAYAR
ncbi:hypothetical protein D3C73_1522840 [compost metagenome]